MTPASPLHGALRDRAPIVSAPVDRDSTAVLATAVTRAGRLGLIGGGYGEEDWLSRELAAAGSVGAWRARTSPPANG